MVNLPLASLFSEMLVYAVLKILIGAVQGAPIIFELSFVRESVLEI